MPVQQYWSAKKHLTTALRSLPAMMIPAAGHFTPKKFVVVHPEEQPRTYRSVNYPMWRSDLPEDPMRYTSMPNALEGEGCVGGQRRERRPDVGMTATETITSNPRVLGADPLVEYQPAEHG